MRSCISKGGNMSRIKSSLIFSVLMLVLANAAAFSETIYGFKAGLSLSNFWGNGLTDFEEDLAGSGPVSDLETHFVLFVTGGIFVRYDLIPDFLAVQPELLYLRGGKSWDVNGELFKVYADYLTIPVVFKLMIPLDYPVTPSAYAGPMLALRLRARTEGLENVPGGADLGFMTGFEENINDEVTVFDVGFATGLSFDIEAGPGDIVLDFRFSWGAVEVFDGQDIRNYAFQLMGGYAFGF